MPALAAMTAALVMLLAYTEPGSPSNSASAQEVFQADFSIVSKVLKPLPAKGVPKTKPANTETQDIYGKAPGATNDRCPPAGSVTKANGDGDGGQTDDTQYDINGNANGLAKTYANGKLEMWCIDNKYFALVFDPTGAPVGRFIGKCPFEGGDNWKWAFRDKRNNKLVGTVWQSTDKGRFDDDAADENPEREDQWQYNYEVATNKVEQKHFEDNVRQDDGANVQPAPDRSGGGFKFEDLRPKNPRRDDPTLALVGDPPDCGCPGGRATCFDVPMILVGEPENTQIETTIFNEGLTPFNEGPTSANALAQLTFDAPAGCQVDGASTATRIHAELSVAAMHSATVVDQFQISCSLPSVPSAHVFTITSSVRPQDPFVEDPEPADDRSSMTLAVAAELRGVGGVAELPDVAGMPLESPDSSGPGVVVLAWLAGGATAGALALGGAAWYARRRRA